MAYSFIRDHLSVLIHEASAALFTINSALPTFQPGDLLMVFPQPGWSNGGADNCRLTAASRNEGWTRTRFLGDPLDDTMTPALTPFIKTADGSETQVGVEMVRVSNNNARIVVLSIANYIANHFSRENTFSTLDYGNGTENETARTYAHTVSYDESLLIAAFGYEDETGATPLVSYGVPTRQSTSQPWDPTWTVVRNPSEVVPISVFSAEGPTIATNEVEDWVTVGQYQSIRTGGGYNISGAGVDYYDMGLLMDIGGPEYSPPPPPTTTSLSVRKRQLSSRLFTPRRGPQAPR